jgi:hypothetical protein
VTSDDPTCVALYFFKHQPPRAEGSGVWRKRRHSLRNEIGIDELLAVSVVRQKFASERRLASAIRSCDDIDSWLAFSVVSHVLRIPAGRIRKSSMRGPIRRKGGLSRSLSQREGDLFLAISSPLHPTTLPSSRPFCRIFSLLAWTSFRGGPHSPQNSIRVFRWVSEYRKSCHWWRRIFASRQTETRTPSTLIALWLRTEQFLDRFNGVKQTVWM